MSSACGLWVNNSWWGGVNGLHENTAEFVNSNISRCWRTHKLMEKNKFFSLSWIRTLRNGHCFEIWMIEYNCLKHNKCYKILISSYVLIFNQKKDFEIELFIIKYSIKYFVKVTVFRVFSNELVSMVYIFSKTCKAWLMCKVVILLCFRFTFYLFIYVNISQ